MSRPSPLGFLVAASLLLPIAPAVARAQAPFEEALRRGKLADAEKALGETLKARPEDDSARFGLGVVQFLRAVEGRMQAFHRHGFRTEPDGPTPLSNLPIPRNPRPEPLDYATARKVLQGWLDDLARSEATLAKVKSPDVKLPLHFGLIRLDFDGDGQAGEDETLWKVYSRFNPQAGASAEAAKSFVIAFDRADVDWLRGYCHVLSALAEALLAHDFEVLFNSTGYLLFEGARPPEAFLEAQPAEPGDRMLAQILDAVATLHLIHFTVAEPERLKSALTHLEAMVTLSRSSWKFIEAEADDDREWVPSPKQASVIPNVRVDAEMVRGWSDFLDEFESILRGKKLAPFWRGPEPRKGINVRRVLTEPRPFDLILWAQGSAAAPFLEAGEMSKPETWGRFDRIFRGEFIGFALWFN